jgi:hypothetical protein
MVVPDPLDREQMRFICSLVNTEGSVKSCVASQQARKHNPSVGGGAILFTILASEAARYCSGELMRSYLENFVEALFPWSKPGGGKTSLGVWTACTWCDGRGYLKKNANVWRACPECYGGHFWIPPSPDGEEFAEVRPKPKQETCSPDLVGRENITHPPACLAVR